MTTGTGAPVVLGYDDRKSTLLRAWIGDQSTVSFLADTALYARPAGAIEAYRRLFVQHLASGARQVRIAGDVPHPGNGGRFDGWDRYESAVNVVWDQFPVRSLCLYDASTVPASVRDVVGRTHRHLLAPTGDRQVSDRFEDPSTFTGLPVRPDPLEATPPLVELHDPAPHQARRALDDVAGPVDAIVRENLLIGISEAVTNAHLHGRPPVVVRLWAAGRRFVAHVCDAGTGPVDPLAGLVRSASTTGAGSDYGSPTRPSTWHSSALPAASPSACAPTEAQPNRAK